jgi:hypothetical protein
MATSEIIEGLIEDFIADTTENGDLTHLTEVMSVGIVVDTDDPLQQGRLRVFCPAYNDDPKKLFHLPWCAYVSPMGGVVSNQSFARGSVVGSSGSDGPVHYGFWSVPDIGAHVLVGCINGDARRRFWLGCLPAHQETHTIGTGRFKHENGAVDGPLTSTGNPIQPQYDKLLEAFNNQNDSAEWKTRAAEYQATAVTDRPAPDKSVYIDDDLETIQNNETDEWVREILGEHGYDWTSYKNLGAFLAAKLHSWSTPGFHSVSMDDRPFNSRIKIRTSAGNQIILDDTNERMYISTSGGKSWVEMDAAGNIDMFSERRLSVHAEKDLNLSAGESIRMKAGNFISMYAGDTRGQTPLTEQLAQGEIRMHSAADTHFTTEGSFFTTVGGNLDVDVTGTINFESDGEMYLESLTNIALDAPNIDFRVSGKDTTVNDFIDFLDEYVTEFNNFVSVFNSHRHTITSGSSMGTTTTPTSSASNATEINDEGLTPNPDTELAEIAPWTNRVPQHEPWPRVVMQDSDDSVNAENDGYLNNVDWIEQFDDEGQAGREDVGVVEGDETIERGQFWRR